MNLRTESTIFAGISIPPGAVKDELGETSETLRFVVSSMPIDFQFLLQNGLNDTRETEFEFVSRWIWPLGLTRGSLPTEIIKIIDMAVKIKSP